MRPLYIIAVLQLYINVNGALAQNASLRGYVFDGSDYMAVEYANVYLDSIFISSYSQAKGAYQLSGIIPGQYTLCVSHIVIRYIGRE